ncbi:MAG: hypothetical protein M3R00_03955 [Pseudomonadota bacterium]|nr:hypothetical protein [Pseudomonadota bacterium]
MGVAIHLSTSVYQQLSTITEKITPAVKASHLCRNWQPNLPLPTVQVQVQQPAVIERQSITPQIKSQFFQTNNQQNYQVLTAKLLTRTAKELRTANHYDYISHVVQSKRYEIIIAPKSTANKFIYGYFSGLKSKIFFYHSKTSSEGALARTIRHEMFHAFINCIAPEHHPRPMYWYLENESIRKKIINALCAGDNKLLGRLSLPGQTEYQSLVRDYQPREFPMIIEAAVYEQWQSNGILKKIARGEHYLVSNPQLADNKKTDAFHLQLAIRAVELIDGQYIATAIAKTETDTPLERLIHDVKWREMRLEKVDDGLDSTYPELHVLSEHHAHTLELPPKIVADCYQGLIESIPEIMALSQHIAVKNTVEATNPILP